MTCGVQKMGIKRKVEIWSVTKHVNAVEWISPSLGNSTFKEIKGQELWGDLGGVQSGKLCVNSGTLERGKIGSTCSETRGTAGPYRGFFLGRAGEGGRKNGLILQSGLAKGKVGPPRHATPLPKSQTKRGGKKKTSSSSPRYWVNTFLTYCVRGNSFVAIKLVPSKGSTIIFISLRGLRLLRRK